MELSQRRARLVARLRGRRTRAREGLVLVEGVRAVSEALDAGARVSFGVTSPRLMTTDSGADLSSRIADLECGSVSDLEMTSIAGTEHPQGVLLVCGEPMFRAADLAPAGRFLLLDGVQDPGNVGTLVRSAVAFGLHAILCLEGTADPWGTKAVRASAGMIFRLPVVGCDIDEALGALRERGIPLLAASAGGVDATSQGGLESFGLAVGNEGAGVRLALRQAAHATIAVPMKASADSLNVGIAGSILMHMLTREET